MHPLKVHSYVNRRVRFSETCTNVTILIIVIVCAAAKAQGRQYTKRMLPPFLVPFCVIRRDGVLEYLGRHPDGRMHYRHAQEHLGALDRRTIRRHLEEARQLIGQALQEAATLLAEWVFWATLPPRSMGQTDVEYLRAMSAELSRAPGRLPSLRRGSPEHLCAGPGAPSRGGPPPSRSPGGFNDSCAPGPGVS